MHMHAYTCMRMNVHNNYHNGIRTYMLMCVCVYIVCAFIHKLVHKYHVISDNYLANCIRLREVLRRTSH